jgi:DNA polymerase-3 subunit gamma/tau
VALALYRKYRPRTFAEVIGQEHVTEPLMQALRTGRLHHAYLFSGPRGCGKTSSARILARSLNCEKGPTPEPCGECESCRALAPDGPGSIDVIEIDAASHGGVDDARDLRERAFFAPVSSRYKVYVIDEAHMVSTQGFNALLKLVEEPPEYVKFIFATTEPEKVLGTIKSRTHHYPFRLMPPSVLRPYLEKLCQQEGVSVEPAVFPLVVRAGGGSARDSLSVLDQLIAGAGVYGVTYARAVSLLGVTDVALIDEMTDALAAGDGAAAFATIDRVVEAGHDPRRFAADLLERLRDLIVLQRVPDAAASGIIEAPEDQLERMAAQAARMGQATVSRLADLAHNGLTEMRGTTAPRLLLELIVARMLLPGADDSQSAVLQRLERMERRLGASEPFAAQPVAAPAEPARETTARETPSRETPPRGAPARPAPSTETPVRESPVRESKPLPVPEAKPEVTTAEPAPPTPGGLDAAAVRRVWDEVLATVRRRSPRAWAVVREAMVRDVQGDEVVLMFQHAVHANMFGAQADLLVEAVREVLGGSWRVRADLGGDGRAPAPPAAQPAPPAAPAAPAPAATPKAAARTRPAGRGRTNPGSSREPSDSSAEEGDWPTPARPGGNAVPAQKPPQAATASEEPPFDPDYDRPPPKYEGFDPGDEPLDDATAVRETSEEQAIRVLTEHFGAERIGEANPRG